MASAGVSFERGELHHLPPLQRGEDGAESRSNVAREAELNALRGRAKALAHALDNALENDESEWNYVKLRKACEELRLVVAQLAKHSNPAAKALATTYGRRLSDYSGEIARREQENAKSYGSEHWVGGTPKEVDAGDVNAVEIEVAVGGKALSASAMADRFIMQGLDTRDALEQQNRLLLDDKDTVASLSGALPAINTMISATKRRKQRNAVILALFIATLLCLLLFYLLRYW